MLAVLVFVVVVVGGVAASNASLGMSHVAAGVVSPAQPPRFNTGIQLGMPFPGMQVLQGGILPVKATLAGFRVGPPGVGDGFVCVVANHLTVWCEDDASQNTDVNFSLDLKPFVLQYVQPHPEVVHGAMAHDRVDDPAVPRHPYRGYPVFITVELRTHGLQTVASSVSTTVWVPRFSVPSKTSTGNWMPGSLQPVNINVCLHAQSKYKQHGFVSGSEVTTNGIAHALRQTRGVADVRVFAPFAYDGMQDTRWDLAIIEGWYGMVPSFISMLRRNNPKIVILYISLDTYPTPRAFTRLDVDGFLTNSVEMQRVLSRVAPTRRMQLAVDPAIMHRTAGQDKYRHNVVYLGHDSLKKDNLHGMLKEAAPFGLAVFGGGWNKSSASELSEFYRGILPLDDIADLYSSARVVIGTTDVLQKALGMVNNRVFEALACGAVLISDHFPALESLMGDTVLYAREPGDVEGHLRRLLAGDEEELSRRSVAGQSFVTAHHTWLHRVGNILDLYDAIIGSKHVIGDMRRHEAPYVPGPFKAALPVPVPPAAGRYFRPNRPLVVFVANAVDVRAVVQGATPTMATTRDIVAHLAGVVGHPEFQVSYRAMVVALVPEWCTDAPHHADCTQVVLPASDPEVPGGDVVAVTIVTSTMHLLDTEHPLHHLAYRMDTVVAVGNTAGVVKAWTARGDASPSYTISVVTLAPRVIHMPWACDDKAAGLDDDLDATVCYGPHLVSHGVPAQVSGASKTSRVVAFGAVSRTGLRPASHRAQELSWLLTSTALFRRERAWVELLSPRDGDWFAVEDGGIPVRVNVHGFDVPGQGSWSFLVNGTEIIRVGDGLFTMRYSLPPTLKDAHADFVDRKLRVAPPAAVGFVYTLRIQARLRDGLIGEQEMWRSAPAHVHVFSRHQTPDWQSRATLPAPPSDGTAAGVDHAQGIREAFTAASARAAPGLPLLALGCLRGPGVPAPLVYSWLRLYDAACAALNAVDPVTETPLEWVRKSVPLDATLAEHVGVAHDNAVLGGSGLSVDSGLALGDNFIGVAPHHLLPASALLPAPGYASDSAPVRCLQDATLPCDGLSAVSASSEPTPSATAPWSSRQVSALSALPEGSFLAVTSHWGLVALPRGSAVEVVAHMHRVLAGGGVVRVVEPDYRYTQVPSRRLVSAVKGDPESVTPFVVETLLRRAGFANITQLSWDASAASPPALAQHLALDTVDDVDVHMAAAGKVFVMEAVKV